MNNANTNPKPPPWGRVIGAPVSQTNPEDATDFILSKVSCKDGGYVLFANAHMLVTARDEPRLRQVMENADLVCPDGMPLAWTLRAKGAKETKRTTGAEIAERLLKAAGEKGLNVYFYGGREERKDSLQKNVEGTFPGLRAAFEACPNNLNLEKVDPDTVERIKSFNPSIIFVGLGCPRQEYWMALYSHHLPGSVMAGIGGVFDILAGAKAQAPEWMGRVGLEWLHRLTLEPGRLWKRYLVTNTLFIWAIIQDCRSSPNKPDL